MQAYMMHARGRKNVHQWSLEHGVAVVVFFGGEADEFTMLRYNIHEAVDEQLHLKKLAPGFLHSPELNYTNEVAIDNWIACNACLHRQCIANLLILLITDIMQFKRFQNFRCN